MTVPEIIRVILGTNYDDRYFTGFPRNWIDGKRDVAWEVLGQILAQLVVQPFQLLFVQLCVREFVGLDVETSVP